MTKNVSSPTYETVGQVTRFDQRDTVSHRSRLVPGSAEEQAYHDAHPERIKNDRRLVAYRKAVNQPDDNVLQSDAALYATRAPISGLALPDIVDGDLAPTQVEADPDEMAARIKTLGWRLGADDVRIGPLNSAWVYSHRAHKWGDPIEITHRFAISLAFSQERDLMRTGGTVFSQFESGRVYAFSALVATQLASYIRALGWPARAHISGNYETLVVPLAVDAGLGELGRCGFLIHPWLGANLRLTCVTTDLPLATDLPVDLGIQDFCAKCVKCAVNCPSGAIPKGDKAVARGVRKWQIDPVKCLLYWGHQGSSCAICQTVCPWSKPATLFHRIVAQVAIHIPAARRFLVRADDLVYGARFRKAPSPPWPGGLVHSGS